MWKKHIGANKRRLLAFIIIALSPTFLFGQANKKQLFFISNSHLDTQWNWNVKTTIDQYIKNTMLDNFALLDKYPQFEFNYEGAIKYMWMKEYYPDYFERLKKYVQMGKWHISGCSIDASDVMTTSAESIIRNFLYAHIFYEREFGVRGGYDIMLPDCFGFSYALPSLGAHCGMKGFHTAKLSWGSPYYDQLPPFGIWQGVDGRQLYALYKMHAYDAHEEYNHDMSKDVSIDNTTAQNYNRYGLASEFRYVGPRSDRGGGLHDEAGTDGENTPYWLNYSVGANGPIKVQLATPDAIFDTIDRYRNPKYEVWNNELPMRAHGVGCYTSKAILKLWNRKTELLADAAEKSASFASLLGSQSYPSQTMADAWVRMLWQQHHDGITGTSLPSAYLLSENDYMLSNKTFGEIFTQSAGAAIKLMDTRVEGQPVVVYNPLSFQREDVVEGSLVAPEKPKGIQVFDKNGKEVLSQITGYDEKTGMVKFIFAASVPSLGYAVYDVRMGKKSSLISKLSVSSKTLSNDRYQVTVNANGDVSQVYDKILKKNMLSGAIRQVLLRDQPDTDFAAWEIHWDDETAQPVGYVDENVQIKIAENGPLRISLRVSRTKAGSEYVQYIRMNALSNRVDFVNEVDWQTKGTMLKVDFPFMFGNPQATFDLSLGTIERGNRNENLYEVSGHQWADVSTPNKTYGMSVLNDCKYGWDKPSDMSLRLTLLRTPIARGSYSYHSLQDLGVNKFTYSLFPHEGYWNQFTQKEASCLNQPIVGFAASKHVGALDKSIEFVSLNTDKASIKAVKKAETTDEFIVRVYEWAGEKQKNVKLRFPSDVLSAREVNGVEDSLGDVNFFKNELTFDLDKYQPRSFAVRLASLLQSSGAKNTKNTIQLLPFDTDMMSGDDKKYDVTPGIVFAYPSELIPNELLADGIPFSMGSRENGKNNAVRCNGQTVTLNRKAGQDKLYILVASTNKKGSVANFKMGEISIPINIPFNGGLAGGFGSAFNLGTHYRKENIAFTATHSHNVNGKKNETYNFLYLYKYMLNLPKEVQTVTLPDDPDTYIFAMTTSNNENDDVAPLSEICTYTDYTETGEQKSGSCTTKLSPTRVIASHQINSNETGAMANDEDVFTKWCVGDSQSQTPWLEYSFEQPVEVCKWLVLNAGSEEMRYISKSFKLQSYENGKWRDVDVVESNDENKVERGVEPFKTSRVRLQMMKGQQDDGYTTRIYEFAVFGNGDVSSVENTSTFPVNTLNLIGFRPNPCKESTHIKCVVPDGMSNLYVQLLTTEGKLLQTQNLTINGSGLQSWAFAPNQPNGLYLCRIIGSNAQGRTLSVSGKLIISKGKH